MRLLSMDWDIASVRRNAVESLSTRFVSGAFSRSTFPLWSRILGEEHWFRVDTAVCDGRKGIW